MKKIISFGLLALVFSLPLQTRLILEPGQLHSGPWEYGTISIYATDILTLLLLFLSILSGKNKNNLGIKKEGCLFSPYYLIIAALFFFSALSMIFSTNRQLSGFALTRLIVGLGLFWTILQTKIKPTKIWLTMVLGATLSGLLGIWQFLTQSSFANKWFGLAAHSSMALGTSVVEVLSTDGQWERWLRAYGSLDHPNMLSGLLAIALLALIMINNQELFENGKWKMVNYILLPFLTAALFFTFSRAAFIALVVGLIGFIILQIRRWKIWLPSTLIIIITFIPLSLLYRPLLMSRFIDPPRIEIKSINERLSYLDNAWQLIATHPWQGVGLGNHTWAVFSQLNNRQISWWYQPVHNTYLLVWSEIGLAGLVAFLALLGYLLLQQYRIIVTYRSLVLINPNRPTGEINEVKPSYFPILLTLLTLLLFDHWLWSLHFGVLLFWLVIALIIKDTLIAKTKQID